jgi:hypothetical protein
MADRISITEAEAEEGYNSLMQKYPRMSSSKSAIAEKFSALCKNEEGRSHFREDVQPYIESMFGFRRYFNIELAAQHAVWKVVNDLPTKLRDCTYTVVRSKHKVQKVGEAIVSALYGALYSVQNGICRAAGNHLIQSAGRDITVGLQYSLWEMQPSGAHPFRVSLMSVHDEIEAVTLPSETAEVESIVETTLNDQVEHIPLISIDWGSDLSSWYDKGKTGRTYGFGGENEEA